MATWYSLPAKQALSIPFRAARSTPPGSSATSCPGDAAIEIVGIVCLLSIRMGVSVEERNRGLERRSEAADDCSTEASAIESWVRSASRFPPADVFVDLKLSSHVDHVSGPLRHVGVDLVGV